MIIQCLYTLDYPRQQFAKNVDGDEAKTMSTDDYSSNSFWKGALSPYRETIDIDDNSIASPDSFHSIDDDEEREGNQSTQDNMILPNSIVNLNIK
jgi:hypothetical protein